MAEESSKEWSFIDFRSKFDVLNLNSSVIYYSILTKFTGLMYNCASSYILENLRNILKNKKVIKEKLFLKLAIKIFKIFAWNPVKIFILVTTVEVINDYVKVYKFTKVARSI